MKSKRRRKVIFRRCMICEKMYSCPPESKRRYCDKCTGIPVSKSIKQMRNKKGKYYDKWLKGLTDSITRKGGK